MMTEVFIGLGSNLGDREFFIKQALNFLNENPGINILKVSSFIESKPIGPTQPDYLNAVVKLETSLSAEQLLEVTLEIEKKLKKNKVEDLGPRTIDLDILLFDSLDINTETLKVPHPRMWERNFVLKPLLEIEPEVFDKFDNIKNHRL